MKGTLTLSQTSHTSLLKTLGKGEIACDKQFLLIPQCFLPFGELSSVFNKFEIVLCKLLQFGSVLNLPLGKVLRVKKLARV